MQILRWLSVLVFGLLTSAHQSPPKELDIETTHTPSDCTVKASKGDAIKVHYVRRKLFPRTSSGLFFFCVRVYSSDKTSLSSRPENCFPMATNLTRGAIRRLLFAFVRRG
jgi:hypothetical protein